MNVESSSRRLSVPPANRYSRLNAQAMARSGMISDHISKTEFMIFSNSIRKPVTAVGHWALTTEFSGAATESIR